MSPQWPFWVFVLLENSPFLFFLIYKIIKTLSSHFREEGTDPETSTCSDGCCTATEVLSARDHLEQCAEEEHSAEPAAPRAPHAPVGSQALQEAGADPAVAERWAPAVGQGLLGQPPPAGLNTNEAHTHWTCNVPHLGVGQHGGPVIQLHYTLLFF